MIADGSEMLMLVLNPGLVGGLVLPVMGAVPDGAIVLFSGLGPDAQEQLKVGVGTLAGSTIMLLTIPWAACALLGRVDLIQGGKAANYKPRGGAPKLTVKGWWPTLTQTGVRVPETVATASKIMMASALTYLVIQGPAFAFKGESEATVATSEHGWAIAGCVLSLACFAGYAAYCVFSADAIERQKERIMSARKQAVTNHIVTVVQLMAIEEEVRKESADNGDMGKNSLLEKDSMAESASRDLLKRIFDKHDSDGNGSLDRLEVTAMLMSMGVKVSKATLSALMEEVGGSDKLIQYGEFEELIKAFSKGQKSLEEVVSHQASAAAVAAAHVGDEEEEDEQEEEEEGELAHMTPAQIKMRAFFTLALGVALVTIFSDPIVDVLSVVGNRLNISPFYVSFIVTPVVSNASELISSILQSGRKTQDSIEVTYSQLLGAATMNNTFCLSSEYCGRPPPSAAFTCSHRPPPLPSSHLQFSSS